MKTLRRVITTVVVLLAMNIVLLNGILAFIEMPVLGKLVLKQIFLFGIVVVFAVIEVLPCYEEGLNFRLQVLAGGYELIVTTFFALMIEILGCVFLFYKIDGSIMGNDETISLLIKNGIIAICVLLIHYRNGFWRIALFSSWLRVGLRIGMSLFWWVFPVNTVLFVKWCATVRRELIFEKNKYLLDKTRVENAVCRTKYPVVMVHGIFFRDWQFMNYWGRIPKELKRNGATVYYGNQQSSLSIAASAEELKGELLRVMEETGAKKVNIVAHSKGGLDSRYAISMLGMAEYVASLTTINTPHRGCRFVDAVLQSLPGGVVRFVAGRYNAIYRKLGDETPDFLAGVQDLTAASCASFNVRVPDSPGVYYQSVMSRMHSVKSAGFPLNLSYLLSKKYEGQNDGLVSVSSAAWGEFMGVLSAGKKGISHGDMIDLMHRNIKGFDVSEFYVQLFAGLKEKGF